MTHDEAFAILKEVVAEPQWKENIESMAGVKHLRVICLANVPGIPGVMAAFFDTQIHGVFVKSDFGVGHQEYATHDARESFRGCLRLKAKAAIIDLAMTLRKISPAEPPTVINGTKITWVKDLGEEADKDSGHDFSDGALKCKRCTMDVQHRFGSRCLLPTDPQPDAVVADSRPCDCPLCNPSKWVKGEWAREERPLPDGPLCPIHPIHREGGESYYVNLARAG